MYGISRLRSRARGWSGVVSAYWYTLGKADDTDPTFWADFANNRYAVNGAEEVFTDIFTFTRSTTGTYFDANGVMQTAAIDAPRFDHNPLTGEPLGLLIEEQRTNLVLNSATGTNQNITVGSKKYSLSFYGTGTITLSGTPYSGSLVGTGAYPNRSVLNFTASAGTLTLTVSGDVQFVQLEQEGSGDFPTSYIPTTASAVTRTADTCSNSASNTVAFANWYNSTNGTVYTDSVSPKTSYDSFISTLRSSQPNRIDNKFKNGKYENYGAVSGSTQFIFNSISTTINNKYKAAHCFKINDFAQCIAGGTVQTDTSGGVTTVNTLDIGSNATFGQLNSTIKEFRYYPIRVTNSELQRITS